MAICDFRGGRGGSGPSVTPPDWPMSTVGILLLLLPLCIFFLFGSGFVL